MALSVASQRVVMSGKIIIVDDHEVMRTGLRATLANTDFKIVAEASSGDMALKLLTKHKVDIVVMDVVMDNGDGLETLAKIKNDYPHIAVLMYSAYSSPNYLSRAIWLGASGFILKSDDRPKLLQALKSVASGKKIWSKEDYKSLKGAGSGKILDVKSNHEPNLTQRETEVLKQVAQGLTNKEIAFQLKISYETVKEHVQHLIQKLEVRDRTQAAVWAVRNGLA
jgi:DNA-binding NarL/FixJ family response regulator